jgi:hypothetical protein
LARAVELSRVQQFGAQGFDKVLGGSTFHQVQELTKQHQEWMDPIHQMVSPQYVQAIRATARSVSQTVTGLSEQMRQIDDALKPAFKNLYDNLSQFSREFQQTITSAGAQEWLTGLTAMAAAMQPVMAAAARAAEFNLIVQVATLQASETESEFETDARIIRQGAADANDALQMLVASGTPEERINYFAAFIGAISRLFELVRGNTAKEIVEGGLFFWFSVAIMLFDAFEMLQPSELSPHDRTAIEQVQASVRDLNSQLKHFQSIVDGADAEFLANKARAEVRRYANVRVQPRQSAQRIHRLASGDEVAIVGTDENWRKVVYRDPLSGQLSTGWVYKSSIRPL